MFSILVSADGQAWETEGTMSMELGRFKEYSGVEADSITVREPATLKQLEEADTLLMYENATTGPKADVVRLGKLSSIRAGRNKVAFRFKETGRCNKKVIEEHARLLDLEGFEFVLGFGVARPAMYNIRHLALHAGL